MRTRMFTLGPMLLLPLAACASAPRASTEAAPGYAVRETALDRRLGECGTGERVNRREVVGVPVALVVRPDGTVDPASIRVTGAVRTRYRSMEELRRTEGSLRSDAISRAAACTFSPPTRNGQPVHALILRSIGVPL